MRVLLAVLALLPLATLAAEVKVVSTVAAKSTLEALKPMFERASPHTINLVFGTSVPLKRQLEAGESFDVTILTPALVEELARNGKVQPESTTNVARSGLGLAARKDTPRQDIGDRAALRGTLASAKAVSYTKEGQSGIAAARLIDQLGLTEEIKPRVVLETRTGGSLMAVEEGKSDIGFALVSEILASPGVAYLGPVPADLQSYMVLTAGTSSAANDRAAAKAFVDFLRTDEARAVMKQKGMEGL